MILSIRGAKMNRIVTNTILKKLILVILLIVLINNFIMPNYVQASWLGDIGKKIVKGFLSLLAYLGDVVIYILEKGVLGYKNARISDISNGIIYYGPNTIFSDSVPLLDINFFNPKQTYNNEDEVNTYVTPRNGFLSRIKNILENRKDELPLNSEYKKEWIKRYKEYHDRRRTRPRND